MIIQRTVITVTIASIKDVIKIMIKKIMLTFNLMLIIKPIILIIIGYTCKFSRYSYIHKHAYTHISKSEVVKTAIFFMST